MKTELSGHVISPLLVQQLRRTWVKRQVLMCFSHILHFLVSYTASLNGNSTRHCKYNRLAKQNSWHILLSILCIVCFMVVAVDSAR